MDKRDYIATYGHEYNTFDEKTMTLTYDIYDENGDELEVSFPAKYVVCGTCDGKGKHVNPSIDSHGISAEEFYEDPDFRDDYCSGMYDVSCYECSGKNVVPEIDEDILNSEQKEMLKLLDAYLNDLAQSRREDEYCRRMGY